MTDIHTSTWVAVITHQAHTVYCICQQKGTIQYSNYLVVSLSHYSSSTAVLTVIAVHVNSTPQ